uniref:Uncharacterized protein n=1 Tax=Acrobeloides nanus TaxID=290746 RepID=A0A914CVB8_9BILA
MFRVSSPDDDCNPLIGINNAKNITITGGGVVNGQIGLWWPCPQSRFISEYSNCSNHYRPRILKIQNTSGIIIYNIKFKNSPMQAIALASVTDVHIHNVFILQHSPVEDNYDKDGIDLNGQNIVIENSHIRVGDDAVLITDRGGLSTNITVRNLKIRLSRGISISSYTHYGVTNVTFENIHLHGDPINGVDKK